MINLKNFNGKVPIFLGESKPIHFVDFPTKESFDQIYGYWVKAENRDRYYDMLLERSKGATLKDLSKKFGVSGERIRQIESKFLKMMKKSHPSKTV